MVSWRELNPGDNIDLRDLHGNWWRHTIKAMEVQGWGDGTVSGHIELEFEAARIDFTALDPCYHSTDPDGVHRFDFNRAFTITTNPRRKK